MKTIFNQSIAVAVFLSAICTNTYGNNFPGAKTASQQSLAGNPTAYNITMPPLVQASALLPLQANSPVANISMFTIVSAPSTEQGTLYIDMNGTLMPVTDGMMLTADLAGSLYFSPDALYNGNVVFTYSASDEEGNISNIATYTIPVAGTPAPVLPVTLLHFVATLNNKNVTLQWQTTNETNTSYFEIQRSIDGNNFTTFATASAKGGNSVLNNYEVNDDLFFYNNTQVQYRIKMVDINSRFKYSPIQTIKVENQVKSNLKAWPLPFSSTLNVAFTADKSEIIKLKLVGVNGAVITNSSYTVKEGFNIIYLNQAQSIPSGTYLLVISNSKKTETVKVVKQ